MKVSFQLTMHNVGSWNGQWTGSAKKYYHTISIRKKTGPGWSKQNINELLNGRDAANFHYNFEDGWSANIKMEIVSESECRRRTKQSAGFCGYKWMIDSILKHGKIIVEPKTEPA